MFKCLNDKMKSGFTLVEMLIAITIIVIVVLAAIGIFTYTSRMQRRSSLLSQLQQEANFIFSILSKEIRTYQVDYCQYGGGPECLISSCPEPQEILYLKDEKEENGQMTIVKIKYFLDLEDQNLKKQIGGSGLEPVTEPVNRSGIKVTNLKFYIFPCADPFQAGTETAEAPKVTILMELQPEKFPQEAKLQVQETINQRYGERR